MPTSKIFKILQRFKQDDWNNCNTYLKSQMSIDTKIFKLYTYIAKYKEDLNSTKLEIDRLHKRFMPESSRKSFQNLLSALLKEIENYFVHDHLNNHPRTRNLHLLEAYKERGLFDSFNRLSEKLIEELSQDKTVELWKSFLYLRIAHLQFFSNNPIKNRKGMAMLENLAHYLNQCYFGLSHFYRGTVKHFGKIKKKSTTNIESTLQEVPDPFLNDYSDFMRHYAFMDTVPERYDKDILFEHLMSDDLKLNQELRSATLTRLLREYASDTIEGNFSAGDKVIALHELGIRSGDLLIDQTIPPARFINMINAIAAFGRFDEAKFFIENYQYLLHESHKAHTVAITQAEVALREGFYDKVIELLNQLEFPTFVHTIRSRWLLLCAYCMEYTEDQEYCLSVIKNFNAFIRNNQNKMSESNYSGSLNLSKLVRKILLAEPLSDIQLALKNMVDVTYRSWIVSILKKRQAGNS